MKATDITKSQPLPPDTEGDVGKLRKALWDAGFHKAAHGFAEKTDNGVFGFRIRMRVRDVGNAPQEQRDKLEANILAEFARRIIRFELPNPSRFGGFESLYVWLKD